MKLIRSSGPFSRLKTLFPFYGCLLFSGIWIACDSEPKSDEAQASRGQTTETPSSGKEATDTNENPRDRSVEGGDPLTPSLAPNREEMRGMKGMKGSKRGSGPKGREGIPLADRPELVPESICSGIQEKSQDNEEWTTWMTDHLTDCQETLTSEMNIWVEKDERCGKRFIGMQLRCLKRSESPTDYENCVTEQQEQLERLYEDKGVCIPERPSGMRGNGPRGQTPSRQ